MVVQDPQRRFAPQHGVVGNQNVRRPFQEVKQVDGAVSRLQDAVAHDIDLVDRAPQGHRRIATNQGVITYHHVSAGPRAIEVLTVSPLNEYPIMPSHDGAVLDHNGASLSDSGTS